MEKTKDIKLTLKEPTPSTYNLYAKVPNNIILYSSHVDHTILPVYLYSWVHQQVHNENLVDTNVALISETFSPNNKTGLSVRIKDTLKLFGTNVPDYTDPKTHAIFPGFSQCISYRLKFNSIKPTTRLQYYLLDRADSFFAKGYTIITHNEYNYIIDWIDKYNYGLESDIPTRDAHKRLLSTIDMLNLYCYMKMRISQYNAYAKKALLSTEKQTMHESLDTISEALSLGPKTISKYLSLLVDMGMLQVNDGKGFIRNTQTVYDLADEWKLKKLE